MLKAFTPAFLLVAAAILSPPLCADEPAAPASSSNTQTVPPAENFDFFSDQPVQSRQVVELPPEKSGWITAGAPLALFGFFLFQVFTVWWLVPFKLSGVDINLHDFPTGVKRGIAMAIGMFGIAFCFGVSEIHYQLQLHGTTEAYFQQMSLGKLIAFTHAHLFGFTTSFFIIGIPFSMQFNHLRLYQWFFPLGLAASLTDVVSWWGLKYLTPNFEYVTYFCGFVFSTSYLYMLVALLRVLLFPEVIWRTDKDREQRLQVIHEKEMASRHQEGDY